MTHFVEWQDADGHVRETDVIDEDAARRFAAEVDECGRPATVYAVPDPFELDCIGDDTPACP